MGKYTWRIATVSPYDTGCFESWLSDRSEKGLFFSAAEKEGLARLGFVQFQKGTPERRRYRLEPKRVSADWPSPEERSLYEEMGWRFVSSVQNLFWVFEAPDRADIPELHTDPAALGELYERIHVLPRPWLLAVDIAIYLICSIWLVFLVPQNPVREFLAGNSCYHAALFSYIFLQNIVFIRQRLLPLRRLKKQLAQNQGIDHNAPYQKTACSFLLQNAAVLAFGVLIISSEIYMIQVHRIEAYPPAESVPVPALSEIEGCGFTYDPIEWHGKQPWGNRVEYNWSLLTPEQYAVTQRGTVYGMDCELITEYYRVRSPAFSKPLYDSLLEEYLNDSFYRFECLTVRNLWDEECAGLDEAALITIGEFGSERLIARLGNQVLEVHYSGSRTLPEILPQLTAALNPPDADRRGKPANPPDAPLP